MSKLIKTNNHKTKKKRNYSDSSMLSVLSKLPLEIISYYPHKSLYRCFSPYLRKNPSIILEVHDSKSIYNKWRRNEAQSRKILRNQKINFPSNKREKKYIYTNLIEEFEYCYNDNEYMKYDDSNKYKVNDSNEPLLNINEKIEDLIEDSIVDTIVDTIDEENFKKKISEQIEEIDNDMLYSIDNDNNHEIHDFIHDFITL